LILEGVFQIVSWQIDPMFLLILQLVIGVVTVVASILLSKRWGEKAVAKFADDENRRREHALSLLGQPLQALLNSLRSVHIILYVWADAAGKLTTPKIRVKEVLDQEASLLMEHLETGETHLFQEIVEYQDSYNRLTERSNVVYYKVLELLKGIPLERPISPSYETAVRAFSEAVTSNIANRSKQCQAGIASGETPSVMLSSYRLQTNSWDDAKTVKEQINSLLQSNEVISNLETVWADAQKIEGKHKKIVSQINLLKAYSQSGVYLRGWCKAGVESGYERKK